MSDLTNLPSRGAILQIVGQAILEASAVLQSERPQDVEGLERYQHVELHMANLAVCLYAFYSTVGDPRPGFQEHHERATLFSAHDLLSAVAIMLAFEQRSDTTASDRQHPPTEADIVVAWEAAGLRPAHVNILLLTLRSRELHAIWGSDGAITLMGRYGWHGSVLEWQQSYLPALSLPVVEVQDGH